MTDRSAAASVDLATTSGGARIVARSAAWGAVAVAAVVLFVRMGPDDALGAIAARGQVPVGVVLLGLAAVLFAAWTLIRRVTPQKRPDVVAGYVCLGSGVVTAVLGAFSL